MLDKKVISIGDYAYVAGDVFIGEKKQEINVTINNITSPADLIEALNRNASDGDGEGFKKLLDQLLLDPSLRKHFNESLGTAFYKDASAHLKEIMSQFLAAGPEGISVE